MPSFVQILLDIPVSPDGKISVEVEEEVPTQESPLTDKKQTPLNPPSSPQIFNFQNFKFHETPPKYYLHPASLLKKVRFFL